MRWTGEVGDKRTQQMADDINKKSFKVIEHHRKKGSLYLEDMRVNK